MIAFNIWPLSIHWYWIFYAISFLLGFFYIKKIIFSKKWVSLNNSDSFVDDLLFYVLLWVLVWWRLWYVFFYNFEYFSYNFLKIFYIWEWWMAFIWAFIWVWFALYILSNKYKIKFLSITDLVISFLPFWLWLWRIWNYLNGELYWKSCPMFLLWTFMCNTFWTWNLHIANQLIESFFEWWLIFFIFQYLVWKKNILKKSWLITIIFVIYYSIIRFLLEFLRWHPQNYILSFWLSISQYFMLLLFFVWIILLKITKFTKIK